MSFFLPQDKALSQGRRQAIQKFHVDHLHGLRLRPGALLEVEGAKRRLAIW